jgi:hypothetical protein
VLAVKGHQNSAGCEADRMERVRREAREMKNTAATARLSSLTGDLTVTGMSSKGELESILFNSLIFSFLGLSAFDSYYQTP